MRLRDLFSRTTVLATLWLFFPLPTNAGILTWEDGACVAVDGLDWQSCVEWVGEGFHVTADMPEWTFGHDDAGSFSAFAFTVTNDWNGDRETHMVFRRDTPFDLMALDVEFGLPSPYGDVIANDGCAYPLELRSSNGGYLLLEPDAGEPGQECWARVEGRLPKQLAITPYPWDHTRQLVTVSGSEWIGLDWFYIGFAGYSPNPGTLENPRPEYFGFTVYSVQVPEPSTLLLLGGGLATAVVTARRRRRRQS